MFAQVAAARTADKRAARRLVGRLRAEGPDAVLGELCALLGVQVPALSRRT